MIIVNKNGRIKARAAYKIIGVKSRFNDWFKNSIEYIGGVEGVDFWTIKNESTGGRPSIDYDTTVECMKKICLFSKNNNANKLYQYLCELDEVNVLWSHPTRKEMLFEIDIKEALKGITTIISQYHVLSYRVDFYLPEFNLVIEYDEKQHLYYKNDKERQTEIENYLQCHFIRVDEGFELEGINKIMKVIIFNILTDCWQNGKISEDQEGLMQILGEQMPSILNIK